MTERYREAARPFKHFAFEASTPVLVGSPQAVAEATFYAETSGYAKAA